jgi:S-adenosylmethionine decarboxylase
MNTGSFQPTGQHLLADLNGIAAEKLNNPVDIELMLLEAARAAGATILSSYFHHFGANLGVTGVVLLAESHISIHTWPECGFAAVDIFMCGATRPRLALEAIELALSPTSCALHALDRGNSVAVAAD